MIFSLSSLIVLAKIRTRLSQFQILPAFHRLGLGIVLAREILKIIFRSLSGLADSMGDVIEPCNMAQTQRLPRETPSGKELHVTV